jgi:hypothetical protein
MRDLTLVLVGDNETVHVRATAETVTATIARSGAGHLLNLDAPARFNVAVVDFLAGGVTLNEDATNGGGHGGPVT